ncbi:MAG: hypothetical protein P1V35_09480 [Planctomycetota bacterium]|nr:hypothetical protein [Planctomycetota bacterium]
MKAIIRNHICLALLALPAVAQESSPTSPELEKAIAVEELEHDLRGAAELYGHLAAATNISKELRARANLRLGLAYRKLGDEAKALAALKLAANGEGDAAKNAAAALEGGVAKPKEDLELQKQAQAALGRASQSLLGLKGLQYIEHYQIYLGCWSPAAEDLVWLGSAAVPTIRREMEEWFSEDHFSHLTNGTRINGVALPAQFGSTFHAHMASILWEIGSPEARAYLSELASSPDLNRSMAAARGLVECGALKPSMIELYVELVTNPKAPIQVVRMANSAAAQTNPRRTPILAELSAAQFLSLVNTVPHAVAVDLWRKMDELRYPVKDLEDPERNLAGTLRSMLESPHPGLNQIGYKVLERYGLQSSSLRVLTLDFFDRYPAKFRLERARERQFIGGDGAGGARGAEAQTDEMQRFVDAVKRAGPRPEKQGNSTTQSTVIETISKVYLDYGDHHILPVVTILTENGYWNSKNVSSWLYANQAPELVRQVTQLMVTSSVFDGSARWLSEQEFGAGDVPGLIAAMERLRVKGLQYRRENPGESQYSGSTWNAWLRVLSELSRVNTSASQSYILSLANGEYEAVVSYMLSRSRDEGAHGMEPALRELLNSPAADSFPDSIPRFRTQALVRLVELGDVETMLKTEKWSTYELVGMDQIVPQLVGADDVQGSPLALISSYTTRKGKKTSVHGYSPPQLAKIWEHHLNQPNLFPDSNAFEFAGLAMRVHNATSPEVFQGVIEPACRAWIRRLEAKDISISKMEQRGLGTLQRFCLRPEIQSMFGNRGWEELLTRSFASETAQVAEGAVGGIQGKASMRWEPQVRSWLFDTEVGATALWSLTDLGVYLSDDEVKAIAAGDNKDLRDSLLDVLNQVAPDVPVEHLTPFLSDADEHSRRSACVALAKKLDAGAVPGLLSLLGDTEVKVRDAAKLALEQIRFYHDEKARWERFFQGQEVSTVGAAQRLLQQAGEGQPTEQRVLAIRSLGTLGTPEVLPFLIDWVASGPPEVISAAKSAIERIHLAGGAKADVK